MKNYKYKLLTNELAVKDYIDKQGSMAKTTKCCATGTCKTVSSVVKAPEIPIEADNKIDPEKLVKNFGFIKVCNF